MPLDAVTRARLRSKFQSQGIYVTDAQIEHMYNEDKLERERGGGALQRNRVGGPSPIDNVYPERSTPQHQDSSIWDSAWDTIGGFAWGLADTATIGLAGMAFNAIDEKMYKSFQQDIRSSAWGRSAETLGGLAGFLVPMTGAARATSLATRTI